MDAQIQVAANELSSYEFSVWLTVEETVAIKTGWIILPQASINWLASRIATGYNISVLNLDDQKFQGLQKVQTAQ